MNILKASALAAALTGSLGAMTPGVSHAQWPDIREAKAIAEEGFIYGLPIVMNYAVMYEYSVDKNSGQFKAPFNQISNEARVFTYKDTAVITPNSDTPYSILWLDLRAEPIELFRVSRLRAAIRAGRTGGKGNPRQARPYRCRCR